MNIFGLRLGRPSDDLLGLIHQQARAAQPTYDHIGSTLDPQRWDGPDVRSESTTVGRGAADFTSARTALRTWVPQLALGADRALASRSVAHGETVVLLLRIGPIHVVVPNRIVAVIDEPRRFAFAYGTLPGHPERGEESFTVEYLPDDTVRATIRVEAGPGTVAARAVAPAVVRLQVVALRRYLRAIADHVRADAAAADR